MCGCAEPRGGVMIDPGSMLCQVLGMTRSREEEALEQWETQLRKGLLGLAVLAALWRSRLYGLELLKRLEGSALVVSEGTIYPLLNRLRAEGLVIAEWVESSAGPPRKYYA